MLGYRLALESRPAGARLVWRGEEAGRALESRVEPGTSGWQRFRVGLLGILPIQGQL